MNLSDKYHMTQEENIFYAKRNLVDSIWKEARLEGLPFTFPETQTIVEGMHLAGKKNDDIIKVRNLKHGWEFLFDSIDYPLDFRYIKQMNHEIGKEGVVLNAGMLRNMDVSIGGTDWKPGIPEEEMVIGELEEILSMHCTTDKAITLMLYLMRSQLFADGNKRTAQLCANQIMIQSGRGIIAVPVNELQDFTELLIEYYVTNRMTDIKKFIYDKCIDGLAINRELTIQEEMSPYEFIKRSKDISNARNRENRD